MPLETGLIAYSALTSIAMIDKRRRPKPPVPFAILFDHARMAGVALILLSAITAMYRFGIGHGVVMWLGQLSIAGVALVLLLSWQPRLAVIASAATLLLGLALMPL